MKKRMKENSILNYIKKLIFAEPKSKIHAGLIVFCIGFMILAPILTPIRDYVWGGQAVSDIGILLSNFTEINEKAIAKRRAEGLSFWEGMGWILMMISYMYITTLMLIGIAHTAFEKSSSEEERRQKLKNIAIMIACLLGITIIIWNFFIRVML